MSEDLWLGCYLGYRLAQYQHGADGNAEELIELLKQLRDSDLALIDPGEHAAKSPDAIKAIWQSIGQTGNRSNRDLARRALEELGQQKDE